MPNWAINRLILSGPSAEIERFQNSCIRPQRGGDSGEINLDFEAIVPMPLEVMTTLNDRSSAASASALAATGLDGWYSWRCSSWGTKWNAANLAILQAAPELDDLTFDTAWSSPEPILRALAAQYPQLKGYALGTDPSMDWSLFGLFADGMYSANCFEASALSFLILDCTLTPDLCRISAHALVRGWTSITSGSEGADAHNQPIRATALVKAALPAEVVVRLEFAAHHQAYAEDAFDVGPDHPEGGAVADLAFFSLHDRSRTDLDCSLLEELAAEIREEALYSSFPATDVSGFATRASQLVEGCPEEELRAWAALALFRPGVALDMAGPCLLQTGFTEYARRLYEGAVAHLNRRAAGLRLPAPLAAGQEG